MNKPLTVYKASAGSGKTFRLAVEYIKLVVSDPQSYRSILAVTFTNKATEEMKMRILSQLYGLWKQLPDSQGYMDRVCEELGMTPDFVSQQAGVALSNLLHNYNYFRVETIDTFFQSVLRNLARELELTSNLRISLNDVQVEELAVDQLIEDLQTTDQLLIWLLKYIMENISDDRSWNVIGQVKQFGRTIFRDYYKSESNALSERLSAPGFFDSYSRQLRDIRAAAKERMLNIAESFFSTLEAEGLSVDDLANKRRGIAGFFLKLQNGVFDPTIENATVANCLGNPAKWYAKSHPQAELIHSLADGELGDILRHAVEERPRQWRLYQSAELTLRHLNQLRLLESIEQKVHQLNAEANRFLLSDTQQLLHTLINDSDSPFIFEKMGTQLEHIMIDEFQDTSTVQWQNFRVLLQETMSHEGSQNLIVGDVKQSIYRWRSGDWRLLNDIRSQFPEAMLQEEPLGTNYRSCRRIVEFNNRFFRQAADIEYAALADMAEAEQLKRAYADVEQSVPDNRDTSGYVSITLLPADDYEEQTLRRLTDTISQLLAEGVQQSQVAIRGYSRAPTTSWHAPSSRRTAATRRSFSTTPQRCSNCRSTNWWSVSSPFSVSIASTARAPMSVRSTTSWPTSPPTTPPISKASSRSGKPPSPPRPSRATSSAAYASSASTSPRAWSSTTSSVPSATGSWRSRAATSCGAVRRPSPSTPCPSSPSTTARRA